MEKKMLRVVVVDDHPVVRNGLKSILEAQNDIEVIGQAVNGVAAVEVYHSLLPDVLILDLRMPLMDGFESAVQILSAEPAAQILIMTTYDGDEDIFRCLRLGVKGYLLKDAPPAEIIAAIRIVGMGRQYTAHSIAAKALRRMSQANLTQREHDVLTQLAEGRSNKDIGRRLSMTEGTVKTHVKSILGKLDAISRTEAVAIAIRRGLIHV